MKTKNNNSAKKQININIEVSTIDQINQLIGIGLKKSNIIERAVFEYYKSMVKTVINDPNNQLDDYFYLFLSRAKALEIDIFIDGQTLFDDMMQEIKDYQKELKNNR